MRIGNSEYVIRFPSVMDMVTTAQVASLKQSLSRYLEELYGFAFSLCGSRDESEDLVAETFLKALQKAETLSDPGALKQWLLRILYNLFISSRRTAKRHPVIRFEENEADNSEESAESFSFFREARAAYVNHDSPEQQIMVSILGADINRAIEQLPVNYKAAIILSDLEGLNYQQIAEVLNVPIGTVRSRISRGRGLLQSKLWMHARDLGIGPSRQVKDKPIEVCDCD